MRKNYCIVTSCDDNLAPYVAIQLTAMADNLKDARIDFFLLHSRVGRKNLEMLEALCEEVGGGRIVFHDVSVPRPEVYDEMAKYGGGWRGEAYYPLCAHLLLPEGFDRALYLDAGDTLILGDISPYYEDDFQGNSLIVTGVAYKLVDGKLMPLEEADWNLPQGVPAFLRGLFNSGSYMMNLDKMREDGCTPADYQYLSLTLRALQGEEQHDVYWGDQGFMSVAFAGDLRYHGYPGKANPSYMPYNFCLWYYDNRSGKPEYDPVILHFAGTKFKPWEAAYPVSLERFQADRQLRSLDELKGGQAEYFRLWWEYAAMTDEILTKMGW